MHYICVYVVVSVETENVCDVRSIVRERSACVVDGYGVEIV